MKIPHVVRNIEYIGGTEKFLISLLKYWKGKYPQDQLVLLCIEGIGPVSKKLCRESNIQLRDFPTVWWNPLHILKLSAKLRSIDPDVVHTHLFQADFAGGIAAWIAKIPFISTKYCQFSRALEKSSHWEKIVTKPISDSILERILAFISKKCIVVSRSARNYFIRKGYDKDELILAPCSHLGLDNDLFKLKLGGVSKNRELVIGTVSRLVPEKGIYLLIEIFHGYLEKFPNSKLLIAGSGYEKERLVNLVKTRGVNNKVHFEGFINDIPGFLSRLDIFLFTSKTEGFPLAIQEAMAAGKAIVTTDVGGIKEVLGDSGLLVDFGDVDKAISHLSKLVANRSLRNSLGQKARTRIKEKYNIDKTAVIIRGTYNKLIRT